uniref:Uncharacterized protein n=1 Tax=Rhizophora mucronata TaxID=61149 RepID=A0A2P2P5B6_RHIMU
MNLCCMNAISASKTFEFPVPCGGYLLLSIFDASKTSNTSLNSCSSFELLILDWQLYDALFFSTFFMHVTL